MSELKRLKIKDIGQIDSGFAFSSSDFQEFGLPVIRMSDLKKGYVQTKTAARVPSSKTIGLEKFQIKPGDLLLGMSGSLDAYGVASEGVELSFINQRVGRFSVFDEEKSCYAFFSKLLTSSEYLRYAFKEAVGVAQLNISPKQIEDFSFPQIPLEEQRYIAQILDTLDTAIHETEAIIAKLKAIKQGLLHDLLTRGIDANGELRPPQTEAPHLYKESPLGWIPKAWDLSTVGEQFEIQLGKMLDGQKNSGVLKPYVGNKAVQWDRIDLCEVQQVRLSQSDLIRFRLQKGDLLVCEGGEVGRAAIWDDEINECYYQKALHRLRPLQGYQPRLMLEVLRHLMGRDALSEYISRTSIAHLTQEKLATVPLPTPKGDEQLRMVTEILAAKQRQEAEESQLDKFRLLKSGLMDDLLTGRVRVTPLLVEASQQ